MLIWGKRHLKQDNPCVLERKLRQGAILYGTVNLNTIKEEVVVFELAKITCLFLVGLS